VSNNGAKPTGDKVTVSYQGTTAEFDVLHGSDGHPAIDLSSLTKEIGLTALDYGFVNTASTKSKITFIDGDAGILRYRGYPIEQVATQMSFLETAWLLIYGEMPSPSEFAEFENQIRRHSLLQEDLKNFFNGFPRNAHPMPVLSAGVSTLSTYYEDSLDPNNPEHVEIATYRLLAKVPVMAAYAYKKSIGQAFLYPQNDLGYVENFLRLTFGNRAEEYELNPVVVKALERLLILHEDHEQNASTSTVRLVGSTDANLFASVSAGISALFGPLHGGANEAVLTMLGQIQRSGESVRTFVDRVKNKEDNVKLMGFGHRVYKNFDPRAKIIREMCHKVLAKMGRADNPLLELAQRLEEIALNDEYFVSRKLYPNVDYYSGIIYSALGIPRSLFTVMFAIARTAGWVSHWQEMIGDPGMKISRPRQLYTGPGKREYVDISKRG
jgi:citrate synthase